MTPSSRGTVHAEDSPRVPDDPETSLTIHEHSPLIDSEHVHNPLNQAKEDEDHDCEVSSWSRLPWWKRPSPYWLIFGTFFASVGFAALLAPKVALYTALACRVHSPVSPYISSPYYTQDEPDLEQKCASDPVVQAVVARLSAVFSTSMGVISCLTAGWWGSLSDRYGRRIVLLVSVFGLLVTESTHITTALFADILPGGYWFPLVGFLIEGLCGSMLSGVAATHAYLADTTDPPTRSRYFSYLLGLMFTGVAVGPALGGLLIRSTGTILSVFYFATVLHAVYAIFILLVLPEPLTRARARSARLRRKQERTSQASSDRTLGVLKNVTGFLSHLVVLLPEKPLDANPAKQRRRVWDLFFIAIAYALVTSALGTLSYKAQYSAAQFNWTPETTSYYVSFMGATRALFLAVVLPFIIKLFKAASVSLPSTTDGPPRTLTGTSEQRSPTSRSPVFDLALARASVGLDIIAYLGMAAASTGTLFVLAGAVSSFSAGFSPAVHALALDIYTARRSQDRGEVGKLFGALSVIQALVSQIVSPALYGFVYFNTVAGFPQAIMIVSMCMSSFALISLLFVRTPSKWAGDSDTPEDGHDQGDQDTATPEILLAMENETVDGR